MGETCETPHCPGESEQRRSLSRMRIGQVGTICETCMDPRDAAMLRAMGLKKNARVRLCRAGEPCIVEVLSVAGAGPECGSPCESAASACRCRIGLARALAERVMVSGVPA